MIVWIVVLGLASYRIWRLVAEDAITEPLRVRYLPGWMEELIYCGWCAGSWVAFGATWVTDAMVGIEAPVLVALGAAVVVGWLSEQL